MCLPELWDVAAVIFMVMGYEDLLNGQVSGCLQDLPNGFALPGVYEQAIDIVEVDEQIGLAYRGIAKFEALDFIMLK